jgi:hypothetical protein
MCRRLWWSIETGWHPTLDELRQKPVLALDVNCGRLAGWIISPDGIRPEQPITIPPDLAGYCVDTRDGHLRWAISTLI